MNAPAPKLKAVPPRSKPAKPAPEAEGKAEPDLRKRSYYIINDEQSADLEQMRYVLSGLSELSWDALTANNDGVFMTRCHISAIFDHLEKSLHRTLNEDRGLPVVWVLPEEIKTRTS